MSPFLEELRRRKVFRVAVVYAATGFVLLQATDLILPRLGVPEWGMSLLVVLLLLGFPVALVLGWVLELTPAGVRITPAADAAVPAGPPPALIGGRIALLVTVLVLLGAGAGAGWLLRPADGASWPAAEAGAPISNSVAVLPFVAMSSGPDDEFFADGLSFMAAHFYHADRYAHLLMDAAAGEPDRAFTREQLAAMERQLRADMQAAYAAAAGPEQRAMIAFNRVLLSDDWTGLAELADVALAARGCVTMMYVLLMGPLGRAPEVADFYERQILCSPLDHDLLTGHPPALIWTGSPRDALRVAEEYERRIGPSPHFDLARVWGQLALSDVRAAERALSASTVPPWRRGLLAVQLLASAGRPGEAVEAAARMQGEGRRSDLELLLIAAWTGDRAGANAAASRIDARPLGATRLVNAASVCYCGSPFDLEATPNLRRALHDGGLEWAPASPIRFPAKSW
jgi:hypothetical protein